MSKKIVFDTSFIIQVFELFSFDKLIDMLREWEFLIPESVYKELKSLSKSKNFNKRSKSQYVLNVIREYGFRIVKSIASNPDEDVILVAKREKSILATGDRNIRRKAKALNIKVLYFRNSYPIID